MRRRADRQRAARRQHAPDLRQEELHVADVLERLRAQHQLERRRPRTGAARPASSSTRRAPGSRAAPARGRRGETSAAVSSRARRSSGEAAVAAAEVERPLHLAEAGARTRRAARGLAGLLGHELPELVVVSARRHHPSTLEGHAARLGRVTGSASPRPASSLIADFVNTHRPRGADGRPDRRPRRPARLARGARSCSPRAAASAAPTCERAHELREAIRALILANNGEPLDTGAIEKLNAAAVHAHLRVRFADDGRTELIADESGVPGALARILGLTHTAMADDVLAAAQGLPPAHLPVGLLRPVEEPLAHLVQHEGLRQPHEGACVQRAASRLVSGIPAMRKVAPPLVLLFALLAATPAAGPVQGEVRLRQPRRRPERRAGRGGARPRPHRPERRHARADRRRRGRPLRRHDAQDAHRRPPGGAGHAEAGGRRHPPGQGRPRRPALGRIGPRRRDRPRLVAAGLGHALRRAALSSSSTGAATPPTGPRAPWR